MKQYRNSNDASQIDDFRAGRASSEGLLAPLRKLLKLIVLLASVSIASAVVVEFYGVPGLRWQYEYVSVGKTKIVTRATYLTPFGFMEPPHGGEFEIVDIFPIHEKKPSSLLKAWLKF